MAVNTAGDYVYYHYYPSLAAASTATVLFVLGTLLHSYQIARTKTWYMLALIVGCIFEVVGYIGRILNARQDDQVAAEGQNAFGLPAYIMQSLLILIAPAIIAASIYMILGRIITVLCAWHHSMIRQCRLTKLFVIGDVVSFMVQGTGAGLLTKKPEVLADGTVKDPKSAARCIILSGLAIQLISFGFFMVVTMRFFARVRKQPTQASNSPDIPWVRQIIALFTASILIFIRSVFRVVEYVQGEDGYIFRHEIYLYIFDAALMLAVVLLFNVIHPSEITAYINGGKRIIAVVLTRDAPKLVDDKTMRRDSTYDEESMRARSAALPYASVNAAGFPVPLATVNNVHST